MKKVLVSLLIGATLCGGLFGCGEETVSKAKYDGVVKSNEQLVEDNENLVKDQQELQAKIDSAKDYFELDENEKEIVDAKIKEVNESTEAQIAEEKAKKEEEEKARKEAEEEAKRQEEEAKRQAEEEAKRQEEERIAQEQAALQPYRDATAYIQQEANKSGYPYDVHLNESTKTIEIVLDTGDTSISDLRAMGYDDSTIMMVADFESCYSSSQGLAVACYSEIVAIYGISDVKVTTTFKLGGESVCTFNQNGDCVYNIF